MFPVISADPFEQVDQFDDFLAFFIDRAALQGRVHAVPRVRAQAQARTMSKRAASGLAPGFPMGWN